MTYKHRKDKTGNAFRLGKNAELNFFYLMKRYKDVTCKATKLSENKRHIDFRITHPKDGNVTIDIKAMKKLNRQDSNTRDDIIWIEFKNGYGQLGWIYGKQDCIGFQCKEGFIIVSTKKLRKLCEKLVGYTKKDFDCDFDYSLTSTKKELYKLYSRKERHNEYDVLTIIKKEDLLSIKHVLLRY
jgi:hypothetical protein